jgi:hypothetical protein
MFGITPDTTISWLLLYTKPHAEAWAEINLRAQGYASLLPRALSGSRITLLFPRYLFVGHTHVDVPSALGNTYGVQYIVQCGNRPARVPPNVIEDLQARMNERGIVQLDEIHRRDPLFAKQQRERVRTLLKFAQAGFRVRSA